MVVDNLSSGSRASNAWVTEYIDATVRDVLEALSEGDVSMLQAFLLFGLLFVFVCPD